MICLLVSCIYDRTIKSQQCCCIFLWDFEGDMGHPFLLSYICTQPYMRQNLSHLSLAKCMTLFQHLTDTPGEHSPQCHHYRQLSQTEILQAIRYGQALERTRKNTFQLWQETHTLGTRPQDKVEMIRPYTSSKDKIQA